MGQLSSIYSPASSPVPKVMEKFTAIFAFVLLIVSATQATFVENEDYDPSHAKDMTEQENNNLKQAFTTCLDYMKTEGSECQDAGGSCFPYAATYFCKRKEGADTMCGESCFCCEKP